MWFFRSSLMLLTLQTPLVQSNQTAGSSSRALSGSASAPCSQPGLILILSGAAEVQCIARSLALFPHTSQGRAEM